MNAYANVSLIENKLDELLSENHLVHTFRTSSYPVVLTISQDASPEAQVGRSLRAPTAACQAGTQSSGSSLSWTA